MLNNPVKPVEAIAEYVQFISLITALYMVTAGILVEVHAKATPWANVILLAIGAVVANFIGTTGASLLLIRPYLRLNKQRIMVYHVAFFIFIVSNIGGALTSIGDPPLFLGFLKGVPFSWTLRHNSFPWFIALSFLLLLFYFLDKRNKKQCHLVAPDSMAKGMFSITGSKNLIWLLVVIGAVF